MSALGAAAVARPVPPVRWSAYLCALGVYAALLLLAAGGSDLTNYRVGLVVIAFVEVLGLHLLVNQSGELSLAHASFIGVPALLTAKVIDSTSMTPVLGLPFGLIFGAGFGLLVGLPALRAKGIQVALVTLGVGVFAQYFLFQRSFVAGPSVGYRIGVPTLLGATLSSSDRLMPVLATALLVTSVATMALLGSRFGRALSQVRAVPDAASAAGVDVARFRLLAFGAAGALAGLGGAMNVMWVQRITIDAYSLPNGFQFLVIAVLAGRGGLSGVALSTALLSGLPLFSSGADTYLNVLGPLILVANLALYRKGLNGAIRAGGRLLRTAFGSGSAAASPLRYAGAAPGFRRPIIVAAKQSSTIPALTEGSGMSEPRTVNLQVQPRPGVIVGAVFMALAVVMIAVAWYRSGDTAQPWIQNQEIISGGIGGLALMMIGATLLIRDALLHGAFMLVQRPQQVEQTQEPFMSLLDGSAPLERVAPPLLDSEPLTADLPVVTDAEPNLVRVPRVRAERRVSTAPAKRTPASRPRS